MNNVRVAVCLVTYNQEKYIEQAINSVLEQKTTFPVDIILGNDCSTDRTANVLQSIASRCYSLREGGAKIIIINREENLGIVGNTIDIFRYIFAHDYTYVAMLDGDDWWCDENKLQMQVELMEKNPTYSFCYTRGGIYNEKKKTITHSSPIQKPSGDIFSTMIHDYQILNGTVMHRVAFLKHIDWEELLPYKLLYLDYPTNVMMAAQGPVGYIDKETYIWRRGISSVSAPNSLEKAYRHAESQARQGIFLAKKYPNTPYDGPMREFSKYCLYRKYEEAFARGKYDSINKLMNESDFPHTWLVSRPEKKYLRNKMTFYTYVYFIKKINTVLNIVKKKLN